MLRKNSQAEIVSEEQLVPRANRFVIKKNNQHVTSHITDTMLRFMPPPDPNNTYIQPPLEIQILEFIKILGYGEDPKTKMNAISKMVATRLHQPWRAILGVLNRCLTGKDSSWDTVRLPILQILWFGMEIPDAMISDTIKKKAEYTYYMAKKVESHKAIIVDKPEEQHVSLVKSGIEKGFMCYGDQVVNAPNKLKKNVVPRKTRSLTIAEEAVVGLIVDDPVVQSLLDFRKGSKASRLESLKQKKKAVAGEGLSVAHNKYYDPSDNDSEATLYSSSSDKIEESVNETDDADESDMDLSDDNPQGDDDAASYEVFMHNKSTATPNSTYLSPTVTSSSLDFIQTLLDETYANELTEFMSHPVYTNAQTTSVVHKLEGNPELTSYISGASKVPLAKKILYPTTNPQPNSLQAKAKKLMQKEKKNMRKINFKKAVAQKFR
ncbi:hypothetical protein Tco_1397351 [Tanacetum coccineum]